MACRGITTVAAACSVASVLAPGSAWLPGTGCGGIIFVATALPRDTCRGAGLQT